MAFSTSLIMPLSNRVMTSEWPSDTLIEATWLSGVSVP